VGFHRLGVAKSDLQHKRYKTALRNGFGGLQFLAQGLMRSPRCAYARIRSISPFAQAKNDLTPERLMADGIRSVEGMTKQAVVRDANRSEAVSGDGTAMSSL
jgi:hypothetical protein